jgi:hypothetical protein
LLLTELGEPLAGVQALTWLARRLPHGDANVDDALGQVHARHVAAGLSVDRRGR